MFYNNYFIFFSPENRPMHLDKNLLKIVIRNGFVNQATLQKNKDRQPLNVENIWCNHNNKIIQSLIQIHIRIRYPPQLQIINSNLKWCHRCNDLIVLRYVHTYIFFLHKKVREIVTWNNFTIFSKNQLIMQFHEVF